MRRAYNASFVTDEDGVTFGLDLGSDFCAEHEWGISSINSSLGILLGGSGANSGYPEKIKRKPENLFEIIKSKLGVPIEEDVQNYFGIVRGRKITRLQDYQLFFEEGTTHSRLVFDTRMWSSRDRGIYQYSELDDAPEDLATAWDEKSFGVVVANKHLPFLRELYGAFQKLDVAIFLGRGASVLRAGFYIIIASKCPEDIEEAWQKSDASSYKLFKKVKASEIKEKLSKAGREYYALSPKWKDDKEEEIEFWLNPYDQKNVNYGWFSQADLLDWIQGKGKIPKAVEAPQAEN